MAKALSFVGNFKGKIGNLVGYQLRNSNNAVTQGIRAYVAEVSNPKTEPQAIQRMKMTPAVNFYRQLSSILDNAWQGQKYGTRSRQYYMGLAMRQVSGIPFLPKGEKRFFPGLYPVAQGALPSVFVSSVDNEGYLVTSLVTAFNGSKWGSFSQELVNKNYGIRNGDRITIIQVIQTAQGEFIPAYTWVRINTESEDPYTTVLGNSNLAYKKTNDKVSFRIAKNDSDTVIGGAIIISRLVVSGRYPQWLRSNSVMFCIDSYKASFMGTTAYEAALVSYMDNTDYSSDWYLNLGLVSQPTTIPAGDSSLSIVSRDNINVPSLGGSNYLVGVATMSDGTHRALRSVSSGGYIVYLNAGEYYINDSALADSSSLSKIQAVDAAVTGWLNVQVTSNDDDIPIING